MKKILVTHSYFLAFDPKQLATRRPYAPIGTLYAAAVLRQTGYEVNFFDTMFCKTVNEIEPAITGDTDLVVIYDDGFNYLTKMCLENMRHAAMEMIVLAKQKGCTVIISSSHATDSYELYLQGGADFVLLGEAEAALLALTNMLDAGKGDFHDIKNLAYRSADGITVKNNRATVLQDLDALPFPAWDLINMKPYQDMWMKTAGFFSINLATTRGCPFKCNWCAKPLYGNRYHSRSPQNVVNELKMLKQRFNYAEVWFCDDIFGLKPGWIKTFAQLIEQEKLDFRFRIQARADLLLQNDTVRDLARAGCENVWMGAESGSQRILDAMEKGTRVEQIYAATRLLKQYGIRPSFFIQFGYPSETKTDIRTTIRMINELLPAELGISISYPLPGTGFYEQVKSQLLHKTNWSDSDDLALMFNNTYQPAFYRRLHRYVHKSYRQHLAIDTLIQWMRHPGFRNLSGLRKALTVLYYLPAALIDRYKLNRLETAVAGHENRN